MCGMLRVEASAGRRGQQTGKGREEASKKGKRWHVRGKEKRRIENHKKWLAEERERRPEPRKQGEMRRKGGSDFFSNYEENDNDIRERMGVDCKRIRTQLEKRKIVASKRRKFFPILTYRQDIILWSSRQRNLLLSCCSNFCHCFWHSEQWAEPRAKRASDEMSFSFDFSNSSVCELCVSCVSATLFFPSFSFLSHVPPSLFQPKISHVESVTNEESEQEFASQEKTWCIDWSVRVSPMREKERKKSLSQLMRKECESISEFRTEQSHSAIHRHTLIGWTTGIPEQEIRLTHTQRWKTRIQHTALTLSLSLFLFADRRTDSS